MDHAIEQAVTRPRPVWLTEQEVDPEHDPAVVPSTPPPAVAKSASAKQAALDYGQRSLDKLMLIAEFDGDQDAVDRIALTEDDDDLPYLAQEIRDDRAIRETTAKLVAEYADTGVQVFTEWGGFRHLDRLTDAADDADERPTLTAETHAECEGRAVYLTVWGSEDADHRIEEVCARPELHYERWATAASANATHIPDDETDEQRAAREQAEATTRKAERARVVSNNKSWRTAITVRRDWVTGLLSRRACPRSPPSSLHARSPSTLRRSPTTRPVTSSAPSWGRTRRTTHVRLQPGPRPRRTHHPRRRSRRPRSPGRGRGRLAPPEHGGRELPDPVGGMGLQALPGRACRRRLPRD